MVRWFDLPDTRHDRSRDETFKEGVPLHPRYNCQRETDLTESSWNNTLPVPCERPDNSNEQLSVAACMCKGEQEEK